MTFRRATDNHPVALELAGEILRRNEVDVQKQFVQAVLAALRGYDSGHRAHDGSVFDQLIDDYLPRLGLEPTADLLGRLEPDHLAEDGDNFGALFGPALERAKGTPHEARLLRLATGNRRDPERLYAIEAIEVMAELGASDFDDLRRRVSSWQLEATRVAPVLFGVARLDDAAPR